MTQCLWIINYDSYFMSHKTVPISSQSFGNDNINLIKSELVIKKINEILSHA